MLHYCHNYDIFASSIIILFIVATSIWSYWRLNKCKYVNYHAKESQLCLLSGHINVLFVFKYEMLNKKRPLTFFYLLFYQIRKYLLKIFFFFLFFPLLLFPHSWLLIFFYFQFLQMLLIYLYFVVFSFNIVCNWQVSDKGICQFSRQVDSLIYRQGKKVRDVEKQQKKKVVLSDILWFDFKIFQKVS